MSIQALKPGCHMAITRQAALRQLNELQERFREAMQIESPQLRSRACESIISEADEICEVFTELRNTRSSWFGYSIRSSTG